MTGSVCKIVISPDDSAFGDENNADGLIELWQQEGNAMLCSQ
jgi:hypothetical protein